MSPTRMRGACGSGQWSSALSSLCLSLSLAYVLPARCLSLSLHSRLSKPGAQQRQQTGRVRSPRSRSDCGPTPGCPTGVPKGGWSAQDCIETSLRKTSGPLLQVWVRGEWKGY